MQLARVQTTLEHSTHASEALASAGQATHPRAARASLNPTRTTRPGLPARRSAPARPILSSCTASSLAMPSAINGYPDAHRAARRSAQHTPVVLAARQARAPFVVLLSGTPMQQRLITCMLHLAGTVKDQRPRRPLPGLVASAVKYSAAVGRTYSAASPSPAYKMQHRALFPAAPPSPHRHRGSPLC